jgi:hypothetical protein
MLDTLSVFTTRADDELVRLNRGAGLSKFHLQVSYTHPEDIFIFHFDLVSANVRVTDTVWVKKEDYTHFESVDCNVSFFHHITDVRYTTNFIDSLVIKERSVTYDRTKIHFILYPDIDD